MNPQTVFAIPPHSVAREVDGELAILDLDGGKYHYLNAVGARIWQLLEAGETVGAIEERLALEYDVPRDVLEQDLHGLLADLAKHRLILERSQGDL